MRDLTRRLSALEVRMGNHQFRQVVIVSGDDPVPTGSDDIHIICVVAAEFQGVAPGASRQLGCASMLGLAA